MNNNFHKPFVNATLLHDRYSVRQSAINKKN